LSFWTIHITSIIEFFWRSLFQNLNVSFDTVRFELSSEFITDIPNWETMLVEIFVGLFLAIFFFWLQHRTSEKIGDLTEEIAELTKQKAIWMDALS
jgi:magnesium-transporting ATPase (P-type)